MFEIIVTEKQLKNFSKKFSKEYGPDFSLEYPEKACLPLDEFCEFYFRSEELPLSFKKRVSRAYNDAISYGLRTISENAKTFDSLDTFLEYNRNTIEDYVTKALFSKKLSKIYLDSNSTATKILNDNMELIFPETKSLDAALEYINNKTSTHS